MSIKVKKTTDLYKTRWVYF